MGKMFVIADLLQTPKDKIRREALDTHLTQKAEKRQPLCWFPSCNRDCKVWVREVRFDIGESGIPLEKATVDSSNYPGPVPGFCHSHIHCGPPLLAERVYFDHGVMQAGFRPSQWWVIFTDGTKQGGDCIQINPTPSIMPKLKEEYKVLDGIH